MPTCAVPRCKSGYASTVKALKSQGLPLPSFHRSPDEETLKQWNIKIKRGDRALTMQDRVCSLHFLPGDIERSYRTQLPDGTVDYLDRGKASLRKGAVPCVFHGYPDYLNKPPKQRKAPTLRITQSTRNKEHSEGNNTEQHLSPTQKALGIALILDSAPTVEEETSTIIDDKWIVTEVHKVKMPTPAWNYHKLPLVTSIAHLNDDIQIDKTVNWYANNETPEIKINGVIYKNEKTDVKTLKEVEDLLKEIDELQVCSGTGKDKAFSIFCSGVTKSKNQKRCLHCMNERRRLQKREARMAVSKERKQERLRRKNILFNSLKRTRQTLKQKVEVLKAKINKAMDQCKATKREILTSAIGELPPAQKEAVMACFESAKKKSPNGRRYSMEWAYECLLMRVKSPRLYQHLRERNILPLPCLTTLRAYTRNMGSAYGFQPAVFELLKEKTGAMTEMEKHGSLLIDEMKLSPGVTFDKSNLQVQGFVDLGEGIVSGKEDKLGDHALVISFQPFRGAWMQAIACFLTGGNANTETLTKLVLEAVILIERSGLYVDAVTTDGATWNRSMWVKFGVTEEEPSSIHPCDPERKMWFVSDFPHLMKCMRNCLVSKKKIPTPEGDVDLQHWAAIIKEDKRASRNGLVLCPKLSEAHINPKPFQKMNVGMVWQFWSGSARAGMLAYKQKEVKELQNCDASVQMVQKINSMADAMNSNRPLTALKPAGSNCAQRKAIEDFIAYFLNLKKYVTNLQCTDDLKKHKCPAKRIKKEKEGEVFSLSTDRGLMVTLKATLELSTYLFEKCTFKYFMTARLNQDGLERFFGLIRQSCGQNTHPESKIFAQLFRLLSLYSLVKPPKGSNITGGDMLKTLFKLDDFHGKSRDEKKQELDCYLDELVMQGDNLEDIPDIIAHHDHSYFMESPEECALQYVGGFTARHGKRKLAKNCEECASHLSKPSEMASDADLLISLKTRGYLTYPSDELMLLLHTLETAILKVSSNSDRDRQFLFHVVGQLQSLPVPKIGCSLHKEELTKSVIKFYLIMRMYFICDQWNADNKMKKEKQHLHRKQAHEV